MGRLPLEGIRIADFCWLIAGPLGTRVLANWGAEVIKTESGTRLDTIRGGGPTVSSGLSPNVAPVFNDCNTSKLSITLDINKPAGIEIAKRIIGLSDVVTNNFTSTRMDRWGLGYDDLIKIKPDIIMVTMGVMGRGGPNSNYGGYGSHINAGSGLNSITGFEHREPVGTGSLYPDFASNPYHLLIAVLAALWHRNRTGEGQFIDIAQYESTVSLLGTSILEYTALGTIPERPGNRNRDAAPHGVYRCAGDDRWIAIGVFSDAEWWRMVEAMGNPEWACDARFMTLERRKRHEDELDERVESWTRRYPAQEGMARLQRHRVAAGVVQDARDLVEVDSPYRERHVRFLENPESGVLATHGETIRISGFEPRLERAPLLGEHTDSILSGLLGMGQREIDQLRAEGVLS